MARGAKSVNRVSEIDDLNSLATEIHSQSEAISVNKATRLLVFSPVFRVVTAVT